MIVDAVQGIEAQTLANTYLALEQNLKIIPVINKIDLENADPKRIKNEIAEIPGINAQETLLISAKEGLGIEAVLEAVVEKVPAPDPSSPDTPLKALIFDSHYDAYRGVIAYIRIVEGRIRIVKK